MTRNQTIHGDAAWPVRQGHGWDNHQRPGILAQFGGGHAVDSRAMQDDDEKYRTEKEQRRHQNQHNDQEGRAHSRADFQHRIDLGGKTASSRRLDLQFGKRLI